MSIVDNTPRGKASGVSPSYGVYTDYLYDFLMYAEKTENFVADIDLETLNG